MANFRNRILKGNVFGKELLQTPKVARSDSRDLSKTAIKEADSCNPHIISNVWALMDAQVIKVNVEWLPFVILKKSFMEHYKLYSVD